MNINSWFDFKPPDIGQTGPVSNALSLSIYPKEIGLKEKPAVLSEDGRLTLTYP